MLIDSKPAMMITCINEEEYLAYIHSPVTNKEAYGTFEPEIVIKMRWHNWGTPPRTSANVNGRFCRFAFYFASSFRPVYCRAWLFGAAEIPRHNRSDFQILSVICSDGERWHGSSPKLAAANGGI